MARKFSITKFLQKYLNLIQAHPIQSSQQNQQSKSNFGGAVCRSEKQSEGIIRWCLLEFQNCKELNDTICSVYLPRRTRSLETEILQVTNEILLTNLGRCCDSKSHKLALNLASSDAILVTYRSLLNFVVKQLTTASFLSMSLRSCVIHSAASFS